MMATLEIQEDLPEQSLLQNWQPRSLHPLLADPEELQADNEEYLHHEHPWSGKHLSARFLQILTLRRHD